MGGPDRVQRQRDLGKLPVRERLDAFVDPGTFVELGQLADSMDPVLEAKGHMAADGCICGIGEVRGRRVAVAAYDFTVMAGSMGAVNENKVTRLRELVLRQRIPLVWLLDSAGARVGSTTGSTFAGAWARCSASRSRSPVSCPRWRRCSGHCAAGHGVHPGARRLHPDGEGHRHDGARRSPPREGRDR